MASATQAARTATLSMLVVGALALQLGSAEWERRQNLFLYGYLDKVLLITGLIDRATSTGVPPPRESGRPRFEMLALSPMVNDFPALNGVVDEEKLSDQKALSEHELPFLVDTTNACRYTVQRGPRSTKIQVEVIRRALRGAFVERELAAARTDNVFFVRFSFLCESDLFRRLPAFLVLAADTVVSEKWSIALSEPMMDALALKRHASSSPPPLVSTPAIRPLIRSITMSALGEIIIHNARRVKGEVYPANQLGVRGAIKDLVTTQIKEPTVFGVTVPRTVATIAFPLTYLAIAVTFLHAVRRITLGDLARETWLVFDPCGIIEQVAAAAWVLATLAAGAAVFWVAYVFGLFDMPVPGECAHILRSWPGFYSSLWPCGQVLRESALWCAGAAVAGVVLVARGWGYIVRLNLRWARSSGPRDLE